MQKIEKICKLFKLADVWSKCKVYISWIYQVLLLLRKNYFKKKNICSEPLFILRALEAVKKKNITKLRKYVTNTEGTYVCYCFLGEWWHGCSECFIPTMLQVAQFSKNIYIHSSIHCFVIWSKWPVGEGDKAGPCKTFCHVWFL